MTTAFAHILLVEDNSFDAKVFLRALQDVKLHASISVVKDGVEAIDALREYSEAIMEELIVVTDLNMPRVNGFDLLQRLRSDAKFTRLPIFVITTSNTSADREKAMSLGVDGYIYKTLAGDSGELLEPIIAYLGNK